MGFQRRERALTVMKMSPTHSIRRPASRIRKETKRPLATARMGGGSGGGGGERETRKEGSTFSR